MITTTDCKSCIHVAVCGKKKTYQSALCSIENASYLYEGAKNYIIIKDDPLFTVSFLCNHYKQQTTTRNVQVEKSGYSKESKP